MKINQGMIKVIISIITVAFAVLVIEVPKIQRYYDEYSHLYFLNVGQGDSSLVKTAEGNLILVDGGPSRSVIHRLDEILPFWVNDIDLVIVSHSHADHIAGLIHVLDEFNVKCMVYEQSDDSISGIEDEFRSKLLESSVRIVSQNDKYGIQNCLTDSEVEIENYSLATLSEERIDFLANEIKELRVLGAQDNENLESIITRISLGKVDVLYTADAEMPVQVSLAPEMGKDIEILKVPHQGSSDSFSEGILNLLSPELGVISVGEGNKFGHPHKETIEGYKKLGINILRTDEEGTVHIRTDGNTWEVIE